jgi:hypothetical protein
MFYGIAADIAVGAHLLWIVFIIFGALPGRRWLIARLLHLGSIIFSVLLQLFEWVCPLTYLEVWLREQQARATGYSNTFIGHYLEEVVYLDVSRVHIFIGTLFVIGFSLWLYAPWKRPFFRG